MDIELSDIYPDDSSIKDNLLADKVVKVFTISGDVAYLILGIEFLGYRDPAFARRLFTYFYRLLDKYGDRVIMLVIYTDPRAGKSPALYEYSRLGTKLSFDCTPYKVWEQSEETLLNHHSIYGFIILVMLLVSKYDNNKKALLEEGIKWVNSFAKRDINEQHLYKLLNFMKLYFNLKSADLITKFEDTIKQLTNTEVMGILEIDKMLACEEAMEQGMKEGIEQGLEQGDKARQLKAARKLLRLGVSHAIIMEATDLSMDEIEKLASESIFITE